MNTVTKIDKKPMTTAERQAKRQERIKKQLYEFESLRHDLQKANVIIGTAIDAIRIIGQAYDDTTALDIVAHQLRDAASIINPANIMGMQRRADDTKAEK